VQHWKEGGHDKLCKPIKKAGGAEQYHANIKYTESVSVAAEACAEDTKGQTCYICTQALHWKTKEGLVRMCACRGTAGFAHVSCLAEQAKILVTEAEENNLDAQVMQPRWDRWYTCSLCEQGHHGVVACALGWACWKTFVGRPETDMLRITAMGLLGGGLLDADYHEDALSVREAELSMKLRLGVPQGSILTTQNNLAIAYDAVRRHEEALRLKREVYSGRLKLNGRENRMTLIAAGNYASSLVSLQRFEDAKLVLHKMIPVAQRALGEGDILRLRMRKTLATALFVEESATLTDIREAVTTLEETTRIARRILGGVHPFVAEVELALRDSRAALGNAVAIDEFREAMSAKLANGAARKRK